MDSTLLVAPNSPYELYGSGNGDDDDKPKHSNWWTIGNMAGDLLQGAAAAVALGGRDAEAVPIDDNELTDAARVARDQLDDEEGADSVLRRSGLLPSQTPEQREARGTDISGIRSIGDLGPSPEPEPEAPPAPAPEPEPEAPQPEPKAGNVSFSDKPDVREIGGDPRSVPTPFTQAGLDPEDLRSIRAGLSKVQPAGLTSAINQLSARREDALSSIENLAQRIPRGPIGPAGSKRDPLPMEPEPEDESSRSTGVPPPPGPEPAKSRPQISKRAQKLREEAGKLRTLAKKHGIYPDKETAELLKTVASMNEPRVTRGMQRAAMLDVLNRRAAGDAWLQDADRDARSAKALADADAALAGTPFGADPDTSLDLSPRMKGGPTVRSPGPEFDPSEIARGDSPPRARPARQIARATLQDILAGADTRIDEAQTETGSIRQDSLDEVLPPAYDGVYRGGLPAFRDALGSTAESLSAARVAAAVAARRGRALATEAAMGLSGRVGDASRKAQAVLNTRMPTPARRGVGAMMGLPATPARPQPEEVEEAKNAWKALARTKKSPLITDRNARILTGRRGRLARVGLSGTIDKAGKTGTRDATIGRYATAAGLFALGGTVKNKMSAKEQEYAMALQAYYNRNEQQAVDKTQYNIYQQEHPFYSYTRHYENPYLN